MFDRIQQFLLLGVFCLLPAGVCGSQDAATPAVPLARESLTRAAAEQEAIVDRLNTILKEQRMALSDGALLGILQNLVTDEKKMIDRIKDLGRRTLGKELGDLTPEQAVELESLRSDQESVNDRYESFQHGAENKAMERPESAFTDVIMLASETNLPARIERTPALIADNQLARSLQEVTDIVSVLEGMVSLLGSGNDLESSKEGGGKLSFAPPHLWKREGGALPSFPWTGATVDSLGDIMRSVSRLEEQAKRQREIADKVDALVKAGSAAPQPDLVTEENEIRKIVAEIRTKLGIIDPKMEEETGLAVEEIGRGVPHLETGALGLAAEPTRAAAEHLTAAAESLKATWKDILARIAQYSQEAELVASQAMGIPHGMSKKAMKQIQALVLALLRVTKGMTTTIQQEMLVRDYTTVAAAEPSAATMDGEAIAAEQQGALDLLNTQVIPFNILAPPYDERHAPLKRRDFISHLLIEDASAHMELSEKRTAAGEYEKALENQTKALEFLEEAMAEMVLALQKLLGQFAPQAISAKDGMSMGVALRGDATGGLGAGWAWELPERQRTEIQQAFRGSFPERYADLIQEYYRMIAAEEME